MKKSRLTTRRLKIWSCDYLVYRYLWPNIEWATSKALHEISNQAPLVLDIGCGHKPYADLFKGCHYQGMDCTTVDASPDMVGDATKIPFQNAIFDIVFSTQVIEHVPNPQEMIRECHRVLKLGGFLILTGPFYWPLHEEPYDFYRFTKYGFENLLREAGFSHWEIRPDGGDWAQIFLSVNLHLEKKCFIPLRVIFNLAGLILDRLDHRELSSANYTVIAKS